MAVSALNLSQTTLAEVWPGFALRLDTAHMHLQQELEKCWSEVLSLIEAQPQHGQNLLDPAGDVSWLRTMRAQAARQLLQEPFARWEQLRPYRRALLAFESYNHALAELARAFPNFINVNGKQLAEALQPYEPSTFARRLTWLRRSEKTFPLAYTVSEILPHLAWRRSKLEGQFLLAVAQGVQQLRHNWEIVRAEVDAVTSNDATPLALRGIENRRWAAIQREAQAALAAWQAWPAHCHRELANHLLKAFVWRKAGKFEKDAKRRARYTTHWSELEQALAAELHFETALVDCEGHILADLQETFDSLCDEAQRLRMERETFIAWLRELAAGETQLPTPQTQTQIIPAASRMTEWQQHLQSASRILPEAVPIMPRFSAAPQRWTRTRTLHPRASLAAAFAQSGRAPLAAQLQAIETDHHAIIREIGHACEVVSFGLSETPRERNAQIAREALQNALALLEFQRDETRDWRDSASRTAAQTLAKVFNENRLRLSRNRLGAFAHLWQQGLRRGGKQAWRSFTIGTRAALHSAWELINATGEAALMAIGWLPAPSAVPGEVVRRPLLPLEFTADLNAKELPAIYRRLFRVEAVQDPRFLIGREAEMSALTETRALWEAGRPVSVLLVGERGSGKTSLLNCALARPLAGLEVIRSECNERLYTAAALREFLSALLGVAVAELETSLLSQRRVIILEELERAFLRQIGHYDAMRELQRLIVASCKTTLWIVVTNQIAFRLLDAAVGLGQNFSHRLNAASINPAALREAILQRHNLSGLRLQFDARAQAPGLHRCWWRRLRGQPDPELEFFAELSRESAGVFRAAFEIWLGQIEAVHGGALRMKPLVTTDLSPVIDDLDQDDLFTLVAVMQHGSLTPEEFAVIFQKSPTASRAKLDELRAREIIEPDPKRPGLRVRPEALRVVHEALYRRNLL